MIDFPEEADLPTRLKRFRSSVFCVDTPWLSKLVDDAIRAVDGTDPVMKFTGPVHVMKFVDDVVRVTESLQPAMQSPQDAILSQRGPIYGPFISNADVSQQLKDVFQSSPNWNVMAADAKEALDVVALKVSRILTGADPEYLDNWDDACNYFRLVADRIRKSNAARGERAVRTRDDRFEGVKNAG